MSLLGKLRAVVIDSTGSMAIETAFVAPVLAVLALGTFEVGSVVSRQHELQTAASEGEAIALATAAGAVVEIQTIEDILKTSLGLEDDQVSIVRRFRCNAETTLRATANQCAEDDVVSSYIQLTLTDTYVPVWTRFGVGGPIDLNVERMVQLS
ncbi:MAG: TadE family protein [Sphingomonadaceae bacterium]